MVEFKEDFFINPDGIKLYRQIYQPTFPPIKSFIFVCHGLFEHCQSGYYDTIIDPLRQIGCMVLTHDHYGHGRSEGARGMISDLEIFIRDVILDIEETMKDFQLPESIPVFLYGHSLGGLISVLTSIKKKGFLKGIILEAPALDLNVNWVLFGVARFINYFYPSCPLIKTPYSYICRNEKYVENIKNDKLEIHSKISAMTAVSVGNAIKQCRDMWKDFDSPVFIGHGDADKLTVLRGSQMFMEHISSLDKTLVVYPNARHCLKMEIENVNVEFCQKIVSWLQERMN